MLWHKQRAALYLATLLVRQIIKYSQGLLAYIQIVN